MSDLKKRENQIAAMLLFELGAKKKLWHQKVGSQIKPAHTGRNQRHLCKSKVGYKKKPNNPKVGTKKKPSPRDSIGRGGARKPGIKKNLLGAKKKLGGAAGHMN